MPPQVVAAHKQDPGFNSGVSALSDMDSTAELESERTLELENPVEAVPDESDESDTGSVLSDRYVLQERLGQGGTATISRARDLHTDGSRANGHVAIKTLRPELRFRPQSIARLQREFRQTRLLGHPNAVRHFGIGCDQGRWYIAMELLEGEALGHRLHEARPNGLPATEALRIAAVCGDVLATAHGKGVTHGDVKPDNVFVTAANEVRLLDFGTAPEVSPAQTLLPAEVPIAPAATRAYASPEVLAGQPPEPRDDVFSLACVIYEMLAGRHPYGRLGADQARNFGVVIERAPGLTVRQWQALASALAWTREARPANVRELLRGMSAAHLMAAAAPIEMSKIAQRPVARLSMRNALPAVRAMPRRRQGQIIALASAMGVLSVLALWSSRDVPSPPVRAVIHRPAAPKPVAAIEEPAARPVVAAVPRAASAAPPRRVSFASEAMQVSRGTVAAAIPIQLERGARSIKISWRTIEGSAIAGRDFGGPRSGSAVFQERQTDRTLYVPIVNDAAATDERSFTVELTSAQAGAKLGSPRRIRVTIQGTS